MVVHLPTQALNGPQRWGGVKFGESNYDREHRAVSLVVADAMILHPKVWGVDVTVAEVREAFEDDHLHAVLVVDCGALLAVVAREDIATSTGTDPAWPNGRVHGRTVGPHANLARVQAHMLSRQWRRLAVVDHRTTLLGLLCLKRSGLGFCADSDVAARAAERLARQIAT